VGHDNSSGLGFLQHANMENRMLTKLLSATTVLFLYCMPAVAGEYGELAGSYTGKLKSGASVRVVIPKSGKPTYYFKGSRVTVNSDTYSGKTIKLDVGSGHGNVTLTPGKKSQLSFKYRLKSDTAATVLTKG
jgi:hypothetical protein